MVSIFKEFLLDESGATALEYGLIVALVSVVGIGAFDAFGQNLASMFGIVSNTLGSAAAGG